MATDRIKQALKSAIEQAKKERDNEDSIRRQGVMDAIKGDLGQAFAPFLEEIKNSSRMSAEELKRIISESVKVEVPQSDVTPISNAIYEAFSQLRMPDSKAPVVNYTPPAINIPEIRMPEKMSVEGWVGLMGVDLMHPLPVQLRDQDGKVVSLTQNIVGGATGGKSDFFTIKNILNSSGASIIDNDGFLKVTGDFSVTAAGASSVSLVNADGTYYDSDNPLPVSATLDLSNTLTVNQLSGANWSVSAFDIFSTTVASSVVNPDNRVKVELPDGASGLTDTELRAESLLVSQVSGAIWSVEGTVTANLGSVDNAVLDQIEANQDTQTAILTTIDADTGGILADTAAIQTAVELIDDAVYADDDDWTDDTSKHVLVGGLYQSTKQTITDGDVAPLEVTSRGALITTLFANDSATAISAEVDNADDVAESSAANNLSTVSRLTMYDGTAWDRVRGTAADGLLVNLGSNNDVTVNGSLNSVLATGVTLHDAADTGDAPLKMGGVAVTSANPTAVAGGDRVNFRADDLGRQLTRPVQVRDLTSTAYATVSNGTETTLFAGATSTYHDLIYILASNNSTEAVGVDVRATVGGNVMMHLEVPANGVVGVSTPVPIPAGDVGATWTIDLPDITGTTVYVSALFSKEI